MTIIERLTYWKQKKLGTMQMLSKAICWRKGNLLSCPICSRPKKWRHSLWENERVYNLYGVCNIETVSFLLSHQFLHEHSPWKGEGSQCHASWLVFDARRYSGRVITTNGSTFHRFWTRFWLCYPWIAIIIRKAIWQICSNCHQLVWISGALRISFLIFWPHSIWLGEWTCCTNLVRIFVGESGLDGLVPQKKNMQKLHFTGRICQPVHIGVALEVGGDGIAFSLKKTGSGKIFGFFGILCWWFGGLEVSMKSSNLWSETAWQRVKPSLFCGPIDTLRCYPPGN